MTYPLPTKPKTTVTDLGEGSDIVFVNNLSNRENLISAYMDRHNLNSQLLNKSKRKEVENKIEESRSGRFLYIEDLAVENPDYINTSKVKF